MEDKKDKLMDSLENLKLFCLDALVERFCNIIDSELYKSLSEDQNIKLRKLIEEIIDAN